MFRKLFLTAACLAWTCILASAQNSLVIYPNPANFGIVDLNSSSYPLTFYFENPTSTSLQVTGMTIAGTNSDDFAFDGPNCVVTILANQTCQMAMTLTPSAMGTRSANLMISVSGISNPITVPLQGTGGNPVPNITALSPPSGYEGASSPLKLTITGSGFLSSSVAYFGNSPLTTSYVSATQLTTLIPPADLESTGQYNIYVANPSPGGGSSFSFTFEVLYLDPSINSASPNFLVAGTPSSPIVINGSDFMTGAKVLWNGVPLSTTYVNSGQLQAQASTTALAQAGIIQLSVSNPSPGGVSGAIPFNVTYKATVTTLDLPANNLVWDPFAQRIYASLPSSFGVNGNTIAVIDPYNGTVSGYHFVGSEPTQIALSTFANYLYVGLNGSDSVQRLILPGFKPDIEIGLDTGSSGAYVASGLAVSPTNAHLLAVNLTANECCPSSPLEFFHDAALLPDKINTNFSQILFANATTVYGYYNDDLSQVTVSSTGGKLGAQWGGVVQGQYIEYEAGLIYGSNGQVFNPARSELMGTFDVPTSCCPGSQVLPDSAINRAYALGVGPFLNSFGITSYNSSLFTPIAAVNLDQITGTPNTPAFIRWGNSGLAFIVQTGCCGVPNPRVVLVQSPSMMLTTGTTSNPKPTLTSLTPASATHGTGNIKVAIVGTGFVPGSKVTWNATPIYADYVSATQLEAYVPGSDIAAAGTASIVITNPTPAGGASSPATFTIN